MAFRLKIPDRRLRLRRLEAQPQDSQWADRKGIAFPHGERQSRPHQPTTVKTPRQGASVLTKFPQSLVSDRHDCHVDDDADASTC